MNKLTNPQLIQKTKQIRKDLINVCRTNGAGHIAPSLSCIDILVTLYYNAMNITEDPCWDGRDRLVFSKAHGAYGLYAILADIGYIKETDWNTFYKGSFLSGCVERSPEHGLEAGTGSLGHGLPMATGIAFGAKLQKKNYKTFCIVGDGEMQEGSNWEAIQFAVKHKLSNLVVIVDNNGLQAMDFLDRVLTPVNRKNDLELKYKAFGFEVSTCNGHDVNDLKEVLETIREKQIETEAPQVLIANTIKGYGLKCMENSPKFHFRLPSDEELLEGNRYE